MGPPRRRDLLGLAAGTATTFAAGCLSNTGDSTETNDDAPKSAGNGADATTTPNDTTTHETASASLDGDLQFEAWFPAPATFDAEDYFAYYGDLAALRESGASDDAVSRVHDIFVNVPSEYVDYTSITRFASLGQGATVCTFDVDARTIHERLDEMANDDAPTKMAGTTAAESDEGTKIDDETTSDETTSDEATSDDTDVVPSGYLGFRSQLGVLFLGSDHLVYARTPAVANAMVEAHAGKRDRYRSNADFAAVMDASSNVDLGAAAASSQQFVSSAKAFSYQWSLANPIELTAAFAFANASSTDRSSVAALGERAGFAEYENQETTTDGRVVEFTGTIAPSEFDLFKQDDGGKTQTASPERPPETAFEFDYWQGKDGEWDGDEEERVTITHAGGDNIELDQVAIHYDGTPVSETARVSETRPSGGSWSAGDDWRLQDATTNATFESGATVTIVWESEDSDSIVVIGEGTLP